MSQIIETLFCSSACKNAQLRLNSNIWFKVATLACVSLLFIVNFAGCTIEFVYSRNRLYQEIIYAIYLYFFLMTAVNYFMTAFLSPGYATECTKQIDRFCPMCNNVKPFRTRHCSICNRCITKWDHHCPWVQQCIGYRNYGQFLSLMFWSSVCLTYSLVTMLITYIVNIVVDGLRHLALLIVPGVALGITILFGFAVDKLFLFHLKLVMHNMTTIEYHETIALQRQDTTYIHPYDDGHFKRNFHEVVPQIWRIFVPGARILPDFDPYFSYDHKFKKDLRCDFEFKEDVHLTVIATADTDMGENSTEEAINGQLLVLTREKPASLRSNE